MRSTTASSCPDAFWILGLALFVYTVGLASGPGFLTALRRRGLAVNALVLAAIVAASLVAVAGHELLGLSAARATGAFTGGETNTPALAAAIETLKGKAEFARLAAEPIVGYSLAYPLGVVLPLLVVWFVLRRERRRPTSAPPPPLVVQTVLVEHGAGTLEELRDRHDVSFGRLQHDERLEAATATLEPRRATCSPSSARRRRSTRSSPSSANPRSRRSSSTATTSTSGASSSAPARSRAAGSAISTSTGASARPPRGSGAATSTSSPIPTRSSSSATASASSLRLRA